MTFDQMAIELVRAARIYNSGIRCQNETRENRGVNKIHALRDQARAAGADVFALTFDADRLITRVRVGGVSRAVKDRIKK